MKLKSGTNYYILSRVTRVRATPFTFEWDVANVVVLLRRDEALTFTQEKGVTLLFMMYC